MKQNIIGVAFGALTAAALGLAPAAAAAASVPAATPDAVVASKVASVRAIWVYQRGFNSQYDCRFYGGNVYGVFGEGTVWKCDLTYDPDRLPWGIWVNQEV